VKLREAAVLDYDAIIVPAVWIEADETSAADAAENITDFLEWL